MSIGLLHPGQMGAALGRAASARTEVLWASAGRSAATRRRADDAALRDAGTLEALIGECNLLISVCPPGAAAEQAREAARLGFAGTYVDANAVSPATAREIESTVVAAGADFVDGGIIGPPPQRAGTTRLYLSGSGAAEVASLFAGSTLEAIPMPGGAGAASALKMAYAAYTKGSAALLVAIRALAEVEGVDESLLEEWSKSQPGLTERSSQSALRTAPKAWRFAAEMEEIAATFESAGLPGGFHRGAAQLYRRLAELKDRQDVELEDVLRLARR